MLLKRGGGLRVIGARRGRESRMSTTGIIINAKKEDVGLSLSRERERERERKKTTRFYAGLLYLRVPKYFMSYLRTQKL